MGSPNELTNFGDYFGGTAGPISGAETFDLDELVVSVAQCGWPSDICHEAVERMERKQCDPK